MPPVRHPPLCLDCGYDLTGLPQPRCPECGRAFDPRDTSSFSSRPVMPTWMFLLPRAGPAVLLVGVVLIAVGLHADGCVLVMPAVLLYVGYLTGLVGNSNLTPAGMAVAVAAGLLLAVVLAEVTMGYKSTELMMLVGCVSGIVGLVAVVTGGLALGHLVGVATRRVLRRASPIYRAHLAA